MVVKSISRSESNFSERDCRDKLVIKVNGKEVFEVSDGEPEDSNLSRDFSDCFKIPELMQMAYDAGKNGEEIIFEYEEDCVD